MIFYNFSFLTPITGWSSGVTNNSSENGLDRQSSTGEYDGAVNTWWSKIYKIGQSFKITKIRIPLAQAVAAKLDQTTAYLSFIQIEFSYFRLKEK